MHALVALLEQLFLHFRDPKNIFFAATIIAGLGQHRV